MAQNKYDVVCYLHEIGFSNENLARRIQITTDGFWPEAVKIAREKTLYVLRSAGFKGISPFDLTVEGVEDYNKAFPEQAYYIPKKV